MNNPKLDEIQRLAAPLRLQVLDGLRRAIIDGRLAPGARLTERELTEMMNVSRTVIREALRQLETEGLIANVPNKGPVVRALSLDEARDLYTIRAVLEGLAARLFVQNADDADLKQLAQALDVVAGAYERGDAQEVLETKNRFYDVLFEGAGSETLVVDARHAARAHLALARARSVTSAAFRQPVEGKHQGPARNAGRDPQGRR